MTCPGCGRELTESVEQCPSCGLAVPVADASLAPTALGDPPPPPTDRSDAATAVDHSRQTFGTGGFPGGAAAAYDALKPGMLLGERYEIVSVLGAGGMGIVYRARDVKLGREVGLKVMRPELFQNPSIAERFRREILLSSKITHKNVLRIHDLGESDGLAYISMNFIEGETLSGLLERKGALTPDEVVPIAIQLCNGLQAAHDEGVIHRDLKPQNLLLDKDGTVYIADFGISRSLEGGDTMTRQGQVLGTVHYMSPEQARGETPDHRADIYSVGMILYKMLAGELPFGAEQASSVQGMLMRVQQEVPPIQSVRPDIPGWLARVVSRALRRDPEDRYPSAAELGRDLVGQEATTSWRQVVKPKTLLRVSAALLALGVIAVALVVGTKYLPRGEEPAPIVPAAPQASLALLPFRNSTGDPGYDWARAGLRDLVRADLRQAAALRLVEPDRVESVFEGLKIDATGELRSDNLQRVASLLAADNMLTATLLRAGDTFRIEATLRRVTGDTISDGTPIRVQGQGEDALFSMVDELTTRIRDELRVSGYRGEQDRGVTELSTSSVDALRLYGEGLELVRSGSNLEAARRLELALDSDPEFAAAHASLAETYAELGHFEQAVAEANEALQHLHKVSPYEAAQIRATKARLDHDLDAAEAAYGELVRISPNSAEAFFGLATVREEQGNLEGAREAFGRVLELDPKHADAQYAMGRVHVKLGKTSEALAQFNAALVTHVEAGNQEGRATVLNGIGNTYLYLGKNDEALTNYQNSLEIRERIGDRKGASTALANIALVMSRQGRFEDAIATEQEVIGILQELGDPAALAVNHSTLGDFYQGAGMPQKALDSYQESMKIVRDLGDDASLAWNLSSVGYINTVLGNYVQAFFFLKEALAKRREIGNGTEIMMSLNDIGILEQIQGRYEEAIKYHMEGLSLAREMGATANLITFSLNMSRINEDQGEYGPALTRLREAQTLAREIDEKRMIASSLADIGATQQRLGDLAAAAESLAEALEMAKEMGNPSLLANVSSSRSAMLLAEGKPQEAAAVSQEAVAAAERAMDHRMTLIARLRAAEAARSANGLHAVREEAESSGLTPLVAQARLAAARVQFEAKRLQQAQSEAEKAIESAEALNQRDLLFQARHLAGKTINARGESESALEQYLAGLDVLEQMYDGLDESARETLYSRAQSVAFRREAEELIQALNRPEAAARLSRIKP